MFFSKQEEKIIGNLFKDISEEPHKIYILEFNDGSILKAQIPMCYSFVDSQVIQLFFKNLRNHKS